MNQPVDLRSDTVTRPTFDMRRAIADAVVGDDVYGEDPTVNELQERVADLLGVEAALFVPTGSMADQIAVKVLTSPGDEIIAATDAHIAYHEAGATALVSGAQISIIDCDGRFTGQELRAAYHPDDHHYPPSTLVEIENTHNMGGGRVWPMEQLGEVLQTARALGLSTMLDGARLWNAACALGVDEAEICKGFDLVTVCLSKGLGAPVGSLIAGSRSMVHAGHRVRKMLGGGMRQAGLLAAAGLYALDHHRGRLQEDHAHARYLAQELSAVPSLRIDVGAVETNIVMVHVAPGSAQSWHERAKSKGLLFWPAGPDRFRLVTHLDVDRAACTRAIEILSELAS